MMGNEKARQEHNSFNPGGRSSRRLQPGAAGKNGPAQDGPVHSQGITRPTGGGLAHNQHPHRELPPFTAPPLTHT